MERENGRETTALGLKVESALSKVCTRWHHEEQINGNCRKHARIRFTLDASQVDTPTASISGSLRSPPAFLALVWFSYFWQHGNADWITEQFNLQMLCDANKEYTKSNNEFLLQITFTMFTLTSQCRYHLRTGFDRASNRNIQCILNLLVHSQLWRSSDRRS